MAKRLTCSSPCPAGDFSSWLIAITATLRDERASDVPCAGCTACCTSSQFVHIAPDETDALCRIPKTLLFPAPRLPRGHVLLGYNESGCCPMLIDDHCSIYTHRPRTCRTYDCRVFPAARLAVDVDKVLIARQARRWQFAFPAEIDRSQHAAVCAAATFLREHLDMLPPGSAPTNTTQLAVLALEIYEVFLHRDEQSGRTTVISPRAEVVYAEVARHIQGRHQPQKSRPARRPRCDNK